MAADTPPDNAGIIDIYLVTCIPTNLKYVGATSQIYGPSLRWSYHVSDAKSEQKYDKNCSALHKAINEYGPDKFTIEKITECTFKQLDEMEQKYVAEFNTLYPNGYNMSIGGLRTIFCEEARKNMSAGQLGKRYTHKIERKNKQDQVLPKHIYAIRKDDIIIGYQIKKFPMGTDEKEYIYKTFRNKFNPDQGLNNAIAHLEILKLQYEEKLRVKKEEKECAKQAKDLPPNIFPNKDSGYYVKNLKDYGDSLIPRRDFETLEEANEFIIKVNEYNTIKKVPFNWLIVNLSDENITKIMSDFIEISMMKRMQNGYIVKHITSYDDDKKPVKIIKRFTKSGISLEEKYEQAVTYVKDQITIMNI
jgi:group I intron endonuclease